MSFDAYRLIRTARVRELDGALNVCFPEKEAWNVYELFHTRYNLHKRAYQHRVARVCTHMMMQALELADAAGYAPVRSTSLSFAGELRPLNMHSWNGSRALRACSHL